MKKLGLFGVAAASLAFAQQLPPAQLTQVPPKPTCTPFLIDSICTDLWRDYNEAVGKRAQEEVQLSASRQRELASEQAAAPLHQLITDQQVQIRKLQEQMQADSTAALQAKTEAHQEGLKYGVAIGAGATFVFFGLVFGIRKIT